MKDWPLGMILSWNELGEGFEFCQKAGLDTFQLRVGDATVRTNEEIRFLRPFLGAFPASTLAAGFSGQQIWDFRDGPSTIGILPLSTRESRIYSLLRAAELAAELHIPLFQTHFGFVPEDPSSEGYAFCVDTLRKIAQRSATLGVTFCLETGQETPITLRRLIEDAGSSNIAVNFDPANLLMYGKANPIDALDILSSHTKSLHLKDGRYPGSDSYRLGEETRIGEGLVDFTSIFRKLEQMDFCGPLIIEHEIPGSQQREDLLECIPLIRNWMNQSRNVSESAS